MKRKSLIPLLTIIYAMVSITGKAMIRLPRLIADGMVIQRDHEISIWGWGTPSEMLVVQFNGKTYKNQVAADKKWQLKLPPMKAGGPYTMSIKGDNEIVLKDILIGDVWLCSGQSNMEFNIGRVKDKYPAVISSSYNSQIRQFRVKPSWGFSPKDDVETDGWQVADPQTLLKFTAVGYFFSRAINERYKVPIGIINTSFGGSTAEAWLSEEAIRPFPELVKQLDFFKVPANTSMVLKNDKKIVDDWFNGQRLNDKGLKDKKNWTAIVTSATDWKNITVPGFWESKGPGKVDGVLWFRKEIDIIKADAEKDAILFLGNIDDQDSTYFNGVFIGATNSKHTARKYRVPGNLIREGTNTIVTRVTDTDGPGGFYPDKCYELLLNTSRISLTGIWKYKMGVVMPPLPYSKLTKFYHEPTALYNNMVHPLTQYAIKGILWYQGESNTSDPKRYGLLFPALIKDMRKNWAQGNIPFIYVQLPDYGKPESNPSDGAWAEMRAVQTSALQLPNTGMAVTLGLGEWNDIHPSRKKEVGDRLALIAEHLAYDNKNIIYAGPGFKSMQIKGNKVVISFEHTGSGLTTSDKKKPGGFAIAGKDKKYVWANAKIDHDKVIIWNDSVNSPISVRYAWANNPEGANLFNKEGLPASPFQAKK